LQALSQNRKPVPPFGSIAVQSVRPLSSHPRNFGIIVTTAPNHREHSSSPAAPWQSAVDFRPRDPRDLSVGIGLIGCGGIAGDHLQAYRAAGYHVVALCDVRHEAAEKRRERYFPTAEVFLEFRRLLAFRDVQIVDIATHVDARTPLIEAALRSGRHVLSQKPFVLDLDDGQRLADLADKKRVLLAVNQNARWAPHFCYLRNAVRDGLIGNVESVRCDLHWDHSWVQGTPFEGTPHLLLFDFAIHWFDFIRCVLPDRMPERIYAATARSPRQQIEQPLLATAQVEFDKAQASLVFDGHTMYGQREQTLIVGSQGTLRSFGPDSNHQTVELTTAAGRFRPRLAGRWFPDGFHGSMGELLCAAEEQRQPSHNARDNLQSLELCFAAVESAVTGKAVTPGAVRRLPA